MAKKSKIDWNRLLQKAKKGDRESKNELCEKIRVRLWTNLQYSVKGEPKQVLEDILHDCVETFLDKLNVVRSNPHLYADKILWNKIGDFLRSRRGPREVPIGSEAGQDSSRQQVLTEKDSEIADPHGDFTVNLDAVELLEHIFSAIKKMDAFCQAYFMARLENLHPDEVMKLMTEIDPNMKRAAFYVRVLRCRRKLRRLLKTYLEER
ncbi:hypothetical protein AMJ86_10390 [bacterium SM23_57]|nr:MAG: hypothetical protein AMJ86_10390 [bacterium SM23_57]